MGQVQRKSQGARRKPGPADPCPQPPHLALLYRSPAEDKTLSEADLLLLQPSVCSCRPQKYHQNNIFANTECAPARRRLPPTTILSIQSFFPFAQSWVRRFHKGSFYLPCLLWALFSPLALSCLLVHLQLAGPEAFYTLCCFFFWKGGPDLLMYHRIYLMIALIALEQCLEAG